jgi:DNA gyrase subunit B
MMRPLVEAGHLHLSATAVLHRGQQGEDLPQGRPAKDVFLAERPNHKKDFSRLKGLGEMDWEELRSTTMSVSSRTLLQITVEEAALADEIMSVLMGDDVESRRNFIVNNAKDTRFLNLMSEDFPTTGVRAAIDRSRSRRRWSLF